MSRVFDLIRMWCRSLLFRARRESELSEELQFHIERDTERRVAAGVPVEEARRLALQTFGGVEQMKEACRDVRSTSRLETLVRDARYAVRRLTRDWRFSSAAIVILALGIGANTAMFSAVNTALFREQPFADPDRLVDIYQNVGESRFPLANSYLAFRDIAASTDVFSGVTAFTINGVTYQADQGTRTAVVEYATASYLSVLGLRPYLGRWFEGAEDAAGSAVAVIGYEAWKAKFGARPDVIGRTIRVNGVPVTIVGIAPIGLHSSMTTGIVTDFWMSMSSIPSVEQHTLPPRALERRSELMFLVRARLQDDVTVAQAQAAMTRLGNQLAADFPRQDPGRGITVRQFGEVRIHPEVDGLLVPAAGVVLTLVGLVLAIACSNLATLLLVRGASRSREVAVRLALGATRAQIVRHLLLENILLSCAGGAAACLLAWWLVRLIGALDLPIVVDLSLDYRVLAFALAVSILTGVAFGLAPALRSARIDLVSAVRDEPETLAVRRRSLRLKHMLLVVQVAISFVLLVTTGLLARAVASSRTTDIGFATRDVAMLETDARFAGYSQAEARALHEQLLQRVRQMPGVESATLASGAPIGGFTGNRRIITDAGESGQPGRVEGVPWAWAAPGYFDTLRIPLLFGRTFTDADGPNAPPVVVINQTMARKLFGTSNAVGRRFRSENDERSWMEVIGVVGDTRRSVFPPEPPEPLFYRSVQQADPPPPTIMARTSLDAATLVAAMQRELRAIDPRLPAIAAKTLQQQLEDALIVGKGIVVLLSALSLLGLSLASLGLYAIVAFAVSRRSLEVGIRMALGARRGQVVRMIVREVATVMTIGIGTGAALSWGATILLSAAAIDVSTMPNVEVTGPAADALTLGCVAVLIGCVAMVAAYVPARRAATADPLVALRRQ